MSQLVNPQDMDARQRHILRKLCERSHMHFTRYMFGMREQSKFILNPHHHIIANSLDQVFSGNIKRLIINVPPGYTKTEMAVIMFILRGLAVNVRSKFIHISYSDDLALLNSSTAKEQVESSHYQDLWEMKLRRDRKSKKMWFNPKGGGVLAAASGGQITGFRAGLMRKGQFTGAMLVDDPLKPDDAYSKVTRERINNRFPDTFKSRLATEEVPIVVIMQRLHENDPTGFLAKGGTGDFWHHLILPARINNSNKYPTEYKYGIPLEYDLEDGALWEFKHTLHDLSVMEAHNPYTYSAQYDQSPAPLDGGIFKEKWWKYYNPEVPPQFEYRFITADTAQKTKEVNDYSVFQCWGYASGAIYLIDNLRDKWEAPDLKKAAKNFWRKHLGTGTQTTGRLREMYVEDKASGTGLIQELSVDPDLPIPVFPIQRNIDKVTRAMDTVPYVASGRVFLPEHADWLLDYKQEFKKFTPLMTHEHDDQIDPTMDAVDIALRENTDNRAGTW